MTGEKHGHSNMVSVLFYSELETGFIYKYSGLKLGHLELGWVELDHNNYSHIQVLLP